MQDTERSSCTACGAANSTDATHCWQCYARFMPAPPSRTGAGPPIEGAQIPPTVPADPAGQIQGVRPGSPPPAPPPIVSSSSNGVGAGMVVRVLVGVVVAAAAFMFVQRFMNRGVQIPDSVAGNPRMTDSAALDFEEQMKSEAQKFGMEIQAAAFGSSGRPDFLLVVANGSAVESTDELFASFTEGINQGGASVSGAPVSGELHGGTTYRCVGASGNGMEIGTCMWRADDHVGVVFDLDGDVASARALTATIYDELTA